MLVVAPMRRRVEGLQELPLLHAAFPHRPSDARVRELLMRVVAEPALHPVFAAPAAAEVLARGALADVVKPRPDAVRTRALEAHQVLAEWTGCEALLTSKWYMVWKLDEPPWYPQLSEL
eukprot:CAMPEP_0115707162 /NCGR_PEP_ID=MMETSP0272-20121206/71194_1 /TAXON_ID=71861 /ORGANISM="Scrippsiella trochoidea, Strain CCMP3099" /LENGTH=118 /DNA_ID=CAMNT_0003148493 /DNA_START=209 /DNA_END=566 /DNA_ORIENTATION=+